MIVFMVVLGMGFLTMGMVILGMAGFCFTVLCCFVITFIFVPVAMIVGFSH